MSVPIAQSILFRGAGLNVVWPQFAALFAMMTKRVLGAPSMMYRMMSACSQGGSWSLKGPAEEVNQCAGRVFQR